jgi:nicotinate phosphoribosyltransferase
VPFAADLPTHTTLLVDTYDTPAGIRHAIQVIREFGLEEHARIRLDSGDLVQLAFDARRMLDEAGLAGRRIFVSGGLDEHDLARLVSRGGGRRGRSGTGRGVSADAPFLDSAYKLVVFDGRPVVKRSAEKATLPRGEAGHRGPWSRVTAVGARWR